MAWVEKEAAEAQAQGHRVRGEVGEDVSDGRRVAAPGAVEGEGVLLAAWLLGVGLPGGAVGGDDGVVTRVAIRDGVPRDGGASGGARG